MDDGFVNLLKKSAETNHLNVDDDKIRQVEIYKNLLFEWNRKVNLTRIVEPEDFIEKHVIDSWMVTKYIKFNENTSLIDVGTGPGIPGILLKIAKPCIKLTLLETLGKKVDFLKAVAEELSLKEVDIVKDRAESAAKKIELRERYDIAIARAVSSLNVLSELCLPFVKKGGIFVAMKGREIEEEIRRAGKAIKIMGGQMGSIIDYAISGTINRKLVFIKKVNNTPDKYPRRPGIPEKKPF